MKRIFATALLGLGLSASNCLAGSTPGILQGISGKVMVNSGKGFTLVSETTAVRPGDQVFVGEDAQATVRFEGADCVVNLAAALVTSITGPAMCQQAAAVSNSNGLRGSDSSVVITPVNGTMLPPAPGIISPYVIAGGIFAANAAAFASSVMQKNPPPVSAP